MWAFGCRSTFRRLLLVALVAASLAGPAAGASLPEIRSSPQNTVPACVTPERLMAFLKSRNKDLDRRYEGLARLYKEQGERWRVRWDYAFFQMAVETNFLTYRRPDGSMGDVDPKQNNFAGLGATGGGAAGDSYPDVATGVLAQIQHLVAYSGEAVAGPVAPRTKLKQEQILARSRGLGRPVRFSDLAGRWAADMGYDDSIEWVAEAFREDYCKGMRARNAGAYDSPAVRTIWTRPKSSATLPVKETAPGAVAPAAAQRPASAGAPPRAAPSTPGGDVAPASEVPARLALIAPPAFPLSAPATGRANSAQAERSGKQGTCRIDSASFGGTKTVLIRSQEEGAPRYTALSVLDAFERSMTATFIKAQAPGGQSLGAFESKEAALARARELCQTR
jgi:hypothetical protein